MKKYILGAVLSLGILASPAFAGAAGLTDTQVQAILSLLSSFGADSAVITNVNVALTGGTPTTSPGAFCHTFDIDLTFGATNQTDLNALHTILSKEDSSYASKDSFTENTAAAVVKFQAKYVILQTGYVGPKTRAKLNSLYGCSNSTPPTATSATITSNLNVVVNKPFTISGSASPAGSYINLEIDVGRGINNGYTRALVLSNGTWSDYATTGLPAGSYPVTVRSFSSDGRQGSVLTTGTLTVTGSTTSAPTISSIQSKAAPVGTIYVGESPTIYGTGLSVIASVHFGIHSARAVSNNDTSATFLVPNIPAGTYSVIVSNASGQMSNAYPVTLTATTRAPTTTSGIWSCPVVSSSTSPGISGTGCSTLGVTTVATSGVTCTCIAGTPAPTACGSGSAWNGSSCVPFLVVTGPSNQTLTYPTTRFTTTYSITGAGTSLTCELLDRNGNLLAQNPCNSESIVWDTPSAPSTGARYYYRFRVTSGTQIVTSPFIVTVDPIPAPTVSVTRTNSTLSQGQTMNQYWNTTNATSLAWVCSNGATSFSGNGGVDAKYASPGSTALNGSNLNIPWDYLRNTLGLQGTYLCVWTATSADGQKATALDKFIIAAPPPPLPTITVTKTPTTLSQGQTMTVSNTVTNATTMSWSCAQNGVQAHSYSGAAANDGPRPVRWDELYPTWSGSYQCLWTVTSADGQKATAVDNFTIVPPPTTSLNPISATNQMASVYSAFNSPMSMGGGSVSSGFSYTWNTNLQIGSQHTAGVSALQTALTKEGVYTGDISGGFYNQTFTAVKAFQQKYGIEATGFVGPDTRAKLNALY